MIPELLFLNGISNKFPFVIVRHRSNEFDFFAFNVFCPEVFWNLTLVTFDDFVGRAKYALRTSVILFKFYHFYIVIIFLELQDIFNGRSPEAINALRVVAYNTYVFVNSAQ